MNARFTLVVAIMSLAVSVYAEPKPTTAPSKAVSLFDGKTLDGWTQVPPNSWIVKDGVMASTGAARGMIYTNADYADYRLTFSIRHVSGNKDHQAGILIFCTRAPEGEKQPDALAGIQFQVPNGGHWDYRPGHNNSGKEEFTQLPHPKFDPHEWSRVEVLVHASSGTARMAVAQPVGTKAVEVLQFHVPDAGRKGPIAWQMHNPGLFDEYKDVAIEENPAVDDLLSVK